MINPNVAYSFSSIFHRLEGHRSTNGCGRKKKLYNYTYFTEWSIAVNGKGEFSSSAEGIEAKFNNGMNDLVKNIGPNEWRISHSHILSSYLNESDLVMDYWRASVEAQGCRMVNTIMLRDPLNHALAYTGYMLQKVAQGRNGFVI